MDNISNAKIKVTKDGPYLVSGSLPLKKELIEADKEGISCAWREDGIYPDKASYSLCRCGKSKNMPFCDGSHMHAGFIGTEVEKRQYLEMAERQEGPNLILLDAYDLCASARFCDRAGTVWNLIKQGDEESRRIAIEECAYCSSGRLVVYDKKSNQVIEPELEPSISVTEDPPAGVSGPLWVKGGVEIESADGEVYEKRNRVTLCRCGKSKNMPFCDSSHIHAKFNDGDESLK